MINDDVCNAVCFLGELGSVRDSDLIPIKILLKVSFLLFPTEYFLDYSMKTEKSLLGLGQTQGNSHKRAFRQVQIQAYKTDTQRTEDTGSGK